MAKVIFTAPRIKAFSCPANKQQAFLWDRDSPGLGLRTTPAGKPSFVFQGRYQGKTLRITIGSPAAWTIPDARAKARELQRLIDEGIDPREQKRERLAEAEAAKAQREAEAVTFGQAWEQYTSDRWSKWGEHHRRDHEKQVREAGTDRHGKPTPAGPLNHFVAMRLVDLTPELVEVWADREGRDRPTQARLGLRLLSAFLNWCAKRPEYKALMPENPAHAGEARERLGKPQAKRDAIRKGQLPAFFDATNKMQNLTMAVYFQALLLTGARPGELLALKWGDIDTRWHSITLRDKDESKGGEDGTRDIPLTPYVWHLLNSLPRRNQWVFSSSVTDGAISAPRRQLANAMRMANLEVTAHGLRRSFASLSEWMDPPLPAGLVAQIQGHKPSATAEKHYKVRELDLLALHHRRFEAWILEQAGIDFDADQQAGGLRVVAGRRRKHG